MTRMALATLGLPRKGAAARFCGGPSRSREVLRIKKRRGGGAPAFIPVGLAMTPAHPGACDKTAGQFVGKAEDGTVSRRIRLRSALLTPTDWPTGPRWALNSRGWFGA